MSAYQSNTSIHFEESADAVDQAMISLFASCSSSGQSVPAGASSVAAPTPQCDQEWETLSMEENPLFRANANRPRRLTSSGLKIKRTWIPYPDTPVLVGTDATLTNRGLNAVRACKNVSIGAKILKMFDIAVAGHHVVERLDACRQSRHHLVQTSFVFLQTSGIGQQFTSQNVAESRGQGLVVTFSSYLTLLGFVDACWEKIQSQIRDMMSAIDSGNMVAEIIPGIMLSGNCKFVISSIVLEEFEGFSLFVDVTADSLSPRGSEISVALRYSDPTLHHDQQRDCHGVSKFSIPVQALKVHARHVNFLENIAHMPQENTNSTSPPVCAAVNLPGNEAKANLPSPPQPIPSYAQKNHDHAAINNSQNIPPVLPLPYPVDNNVPPPSAPSHEAILRELSMLNPKSSSAVAPYAPVVAEIQKSYYTVHYEENAATPLAPVEAEKPKSYPYTVHYAQDAAYESSPSPASIKNISRPAEDKRERDSSSNSTKKTEKRSRDKSPRGKSSSRPRSPPPKSSRSNEGNRNGTSGGGGGSGGSSSSTNNRYNINTKKDSIR